MWHVRTYRVAVHVPVSIHAEGRGDEYRVVNFQVGGAELAGTFDVFRTDVLAAALHLARDRQQSLELVRNRCALRTLLHIQDKLFIAVQMISGHRAMNRLAEKAVVTRRNVGSDQFALAWRQRAGDRATCVSIRGGPPILALIDLR